MGTLVEDETLLGLVEDAGFEEDEFGLVVTEEPPLVIDDEELSGLDVPGSEISLESNISEDEPLSAPAEDTVFEEDISCEELPFSPAEAETFEEELSLKLIVVIEFDGDVLVQPAVSITAAEARPAHIIFFIFNTLSLNRRSQRPRRQTKPNLLTVPQR